VIGGSAAAVLRAPVGEESEGAREGTALGRQAVLEAWRSLRVGGRRQQTIGLQAAQPIGQDVRGDAGNARLELAVAERSGQQHLDDPRAPSVTDPLQRCAERRTADRDAAGGGHVLMVGVRRSGACMFSGGAVACHLHFASIA
jgi:hypothetical protein